MFHICEKCMEIVRRARRLPPSELFCGLCRGRYEIILFHEGLGPKPDWWDKAGAVFLTPPKAPRHEVTAPNSGLRRR